jgi:phospholipase D1/2
VPRSRFLWRALVGVLLAACIGGALYLWRTGNLQPTAVRAWLDTLGPIAPVALVGAFIAGAFLGVPGVVFVVAGRLAFGPWGGFVAGYVGGLLAVLSPFITARLLRRVVAEPMKPRHRWIARAFEQVEHRPVRAVLLIRLVVWYNAPVSYALAITEIRLRAYALGCALALAPVTAMVVSATGWFM